MKIYFYSAEYSNTMGQLPNTISTLQQYKDWPTFYATGEFEDNEAAIRVGFTYIYTSTIPLSKEDIDTKGNLLFLKHYQTGFNTLKYAFTGDESSNSIILKWFSFQDLFTNVYQGKVSDFYISIWYEQGMGSTEKIKLHEMHVILPPEILPKINSINYNSDFINSLEKTKFLSSKYLYPNFMEKNSSPIKLDINYSVYQFSYPEENNNFTIRQLKGSNVIKNYTFPVNFPDAPDYLFPGIAELITTLDTTIQLEDENFSEKDPFLLYDGRRTSTPAMRIQSDIFDYYEPPQIENVQIRDNKDSIDVEIKTIIKNIPDNENNNLNNATIIANLYAENGSLFSETTSTTSSQDGYITFNLNLPKYEDEFYNLKITLTDTADESTTYSQRILPSTLLINVNKEGNGIGIGKICENENTLEIGMDTKFFNNVNIPEYKETVNGQNVFKEWKFPDGTMIQAFHGYLSIESLSPTLGGNLYHRSRIYSEIKWPTPFVIKEEDQEPVTLLNATSRINTADTVGWVSCHPSPTSIGLVCYISVYNKSVPFELPYQETVIGRWK